MDGMIFLFICLAVGLLIGAAALWEQSRTRALDRELTAYLAEGALSAETAKAIRATGATIARKREIAALVAEGMPPDDALTMLNAMQEA
ncbi:MAG: hypothetical protein ACTS3F_13345 [Phycisphaerales bacterium]